jgi:hypothetical protein
MPVNMSIKLRVTFAGLLVLSALLPLTPTLAQTPGAPPPPPRQVRPRVEVGPPPIIYRRCTDWYELQHRPSGTVLYPQMHCWWVRG